MMNSLVHIRLVAAVLMTNRLHAFDSPIDYRDTCEKFVGTGASDYCLSTHTM